MPLLLKSIFKSLTEGRGVSGEWAGWAIAQPNFWQNRRRRRPAAVRCITICPPSFR